MKNVADNAGTAPPSPRQQPNRASRNEARPPVNVETVICARTADPSVRLKLDMAAQGEVTLSIAQARALSLALIAAVNKQEQHAHARHQRARLAVAPQPAER